MEKYTIACLSVHLVNELKQLYLIFLNCHVLYIVHYSRVGENIIDYIFLLLPTSNNDAVMGTIFLYFFIKGLEAPFSVQGGFYTLCSIVQYFTLSVGMRTACWCFFHCFGSELT